FRGGMKLPWRPSEAACQLPIGGIRSPSTTRYSVVFLAILAVYNVAAWLLFGSQYPWRALSARANVLFVSELGELLAIWLLWRWVHPGRDIWERIVGILMTPVYLGTVLALPAGLLLSGGAQVNPLVLACYICGGQCLQFTFYALLAHCLSMCYRFLIGTQLGPMLNKGFFCAALPLAVSVAMTTAGLSGVSSSALSAGRGIPVRRIDIELPRLPSSMRGLQVALVSDLHIGPTVGVPDVAGLVTQLNGLKPDVVALVGDLADTPGTQFLSAAAPLANVQAKLAKVYVTGNHEYLTMRPQAWIRAVAAAGFQPLANQARRIGGLCLAGVNDQFADVATDSAELHYNLSAALSACRPSDAVVLLAHQPSVAKDAISSGANVDLILCGHTHAGQFFPLTILAKLVFPFNYGYYRVGRYQIFVTSGAMYYGPPLRTLTQQEIALVRLV
ncbi:hypothetical protein BOX15_Mlig023053g1, partial [Macrostomum lignano]